MNPHSLSTHTDAFIEPSVADDDPSRRYQFERLGYFWRDPVDSRPEQLVFNRIVALKSSWSNPRLRLRRLPKEGVPTPANRCPPRLHTPQ